MSAGVLPARSPTIGGQRQQLWRAMAVALFIGLPLLALAITALQLTAASEALNAAAGSEDAAMMIVHQLERRTRPKQATDVSAIYLKSASASLARAELQTLTARLVEASMGHLVETQVAEPSNQDPMGRTAVQLTLDISNAGLLDLLYALETGAPVLTVPELNAHTSVATEQESSIPGLLHVQMTVQGFWKAPTP